MVKRRFFGWSRRGMEKVFYLFGFPLLKRRPKASVDLLLRELLYLKQVYLPAAVKHPEIFGKYKGIHRGQDVAIVATGPTLDDYVPIPGVIHIGVNRSFQATHIPLDYLFAIDDLHVDVDSIANYRPDSCKKFMAYNVMEANRMSPEHVLEACNAERFYFEMGLVHTPWQRIPVDISCSPFLAYESVVTVAFQFALWTRPRRIYLIGCDCSLGGYFQQEKSDVPQFIQVGAVWQSWNKMKDFAAHVHSDVEIVSINPVGLKGLFTDKYTK